MPEPLFRRQWYRVAITSDRSITGLLWPLPPAPGIAPAPAPGPGVAPAPAPAPGIASSPPALPRNPPPNAFAISILNISAGGIAASFRIEMDQPTLQPGDMIGVALERRTQRLMVRAEVRHTQLSPGAGSFKLGMRFLLDPGSVADRRMLSDLHALIAELEREQLQRRAKYGTHEQEKGETKTQGE